MKKAIDWLALVVGLVLTAFGARWMWTGWDIVQAERGSASLIAGSVMLSGGLIVAMLAWTVMRLSAPAVSRREAAPDIVAPEEERAAPPSRPKIPATVVAAGAGAVAATAAAGGAGGRRAPRASAGRGRAQAGTNSRSSGGNATALAACRAANSWRIAAHERGARRARVARKAF